LGGALLNDGSFGTVVVTVSILIPAGATMPSTLPEPPFSLTMATVGFWLFGSKRAPLLTTAVLPRSVRSCPEAVPLAIAGARADSVVISFPELSVTVIVRGVVQL